MRKIWGALLTLLVLTAVCTGTSFAAEDTQSFRYELTVDGQTHKEVYPGDVITVALYLYRTDCEENYKLYAMQDEIRYDTQFFELVEGSEFLADKIRSADLAKDERYREFYMNYVSFGGGEIWRAKTLIGTFQLRVLDGASGETVITNEDYLVSHRDGYGNFPCEANDLTVTVTTACTVRFSSKGGTAIGDVSVGHGGTVAKPADPQREGKYFGGWFTDLDCTQPWDFDTDTVSRNMTLYAKWTDTPPTVDTAGAAEDSVGGGTIPTAAVVLLLLVVPSLLLVRRKSEKK